MKISDVEQIDRDAAAYLLSGSASRSQIAAIRNGENDGHKAVQAFAAHRLYAHLGLSSKPSQHP